MQAVQTKGFALLAIALSTAVASYAFDQQHEQASAASGTRPSINNEMTEGHTPALQERAPRYRLCPGDTFDLVFPFTPEFNQTAITIQPDGYINLTDVGDIHVAGETVTELKAAVEKIYAHTLHDPVVNVVLKDFQKPYFIATGELARPGKYELREDITLTQAIAIAGGFTENSKHSEVMLFRRVSNGWVEIKKVNVKKMFKSADLAEDMHLQPGDMVFVPQSGFSKVKRYIPSPGVGMTVTPY